MQRSKTASLFDHLIGTAEQYRRNIKANRFGGLEVDDQLELGGKGDRQVGRLGALEEKAHMRSPRRYATRIAITRAPAEASE
jgi:hypothetical protein